MIKISNIYKSPEEASPIRKRPVDSQKIISEKPKNLCQPEEIYNMALLLAKKKIETISKYGSFEIETRDIKLISFLLKCLDQDPAALFAYFKEETPSNYLYAHSVNVCILSLILAKRMVFNQDQLIKLALAAFFHDIGMSYHIDIFNKSESLSSGDIKAIKTHAEKGEQLFKNTNNLSPDLRAEIGQIIGQHHERDDASGYPQGLDGGVINNFARIICISDVYEALVHSRSWRKRFNCAKAIEIILDMKGKQFSMNAVKLLVDELTIFPVGSSLKLNDGRLVEVVAVTVNSLTSPKVKVIGQESGESEKDEIIDLSKQKLLSIEEVVEYSN